MLTKVTILSTEKFPHKDKEGCRVAMMLSDPMEPIVVTIWSSDVDKMVHVPFEKLVGQEAFVGLQTDIYQGKQQYKIYTPTLPQPARLPTAAKAAS